MGSITWKYRVYRMINALPGLSSAVDRYRDWKSFRQYSQRGTFAQHGEDTFLLKYFGDHVGTYVDIGANHPFRISNTYMLYQRGWHGLVIDPIPNQIAAHRRWRPRDTQLNIAVGPKAETLKFYYLYPSVLSTFDPQVAEGYLADGSLLRATYDIKVRTLATVLSSFNNGSCDLLSVDTEGFDARILKSNDWESYRPRLVIFERNDEGAPCECSELLLANGYKFVQQCGCNHVFEAQ